MSSFQKAIKYLAIAFAIFLIVSIFGGILGAVGILDGLFGRESATGDLKTYAVSEDITSLKVTINAADFTIKSDDAFSVESNLSNLTVQEKNGTLVITEKKKSGLNYNDAVLTLCIPEGFKFEEAQLTTGAGMLTVETLSAKKLQMELGAGEVNIQQLNADSKAKISGGAGALTISSGVLNDLDVKMGIGEMNLTAALLGSSELDYGIGEANLTLLGSKDDYRLELEKGIGDIRVEDQSMRNDSVYGSGMNEVEITGGIGAVYIVFQ